MKCSGVEARRSHSSASGTSTPSIQRRATRKRWLCWQNTTCDTCSSARMERERYGPAVADRFETLLEPVYRGGETSIYQVPSQPARNAKPGGTQAAF